MPALVAQLAVVPALVTQLAEIQGSFVRALEVVGARTPAAAGGATVSIIPAIEAAPLIRRGRPNLNKQQRAKKKREKQRLAEQDTIGSRQSEDDEALR